MRVLQRVLFAIHSILDINECGSNPCLNGATCNNLVNEFNCSCAPGYDGKHCQTGKRRRVVDYVRGRCEGINWLHIHSNLDVNECGSSPCSNGATCKDLVNGYNCSCAPGYDGTHCKTGNGRLVSGQVCMRVLRKVLFAIHSILDINECGSNPCLNGATCKDLENVYNCSCTPGYSGTHCQTGKGWLHVYIIRSCIRVLQWDLFCFVFVFL